MSIIYKTTNLLNGKIYIGQCNFKGRGTYLGSGTYFKRALKKYGRNNFIRETIIEGDFDKLTIDELETQYIKEFDATNPEIGYNILEIGGSCLGVKRSEETKEKLRLATLGHHRNLGVKKSEEAIKNMSLCRIGKKVTQETKDNMSKAHKERLKDKEGNRKGIKLTQEHIDKIMATKLLNNYNPSKEIEKYSLEDILLDSYKSIIEASRANNISKSSLSHFFTDKNRVTCGGYKWKYKNGNNNNEGNNKIHEVDGLQTE